VIRSGTATTQKQEHIGTDRKGILLLLDGTRVARSLLRVIGIMSTGRQRPLSSLGSLFFSLSLRIGWQLWVVAHVQWDIRMQPKQFANIVATMIPKKCSNTLLPEIPNSRISEGVMNVKSEMIKCCRSRNEIVPTLP
jgi:hypothetical protein